MYLYVFPTWLCDYYLLMCLTCFSLGSVVVPTLDAFTEHISISVNCRIRLIVRIYVVLQHFYAFCAASTGLLLTQAICFAM